MVDMTAQPFAQFGAAAGVKRAIDVAVAAAGLVATAPVLAAIWLMLLMTGGAPIYRQTRLGRGGRRFQCLKFRTMRTEADAEIAALIGGDPAFAAAWAAHQKAPSDPRVTALGRHLRRWGLDEIPQLINVLAGDMSLIGPRPLIAPEIDGYPADRAYAAGAAFHAYAAMRPGITGLWQISGGPERPYRHRIDCDRAYALQWSLRLDMRIAIRTPLAVFRRRSG